MVKAMDGDALLKLVETTSKATAIEVVNALSADKQVPEAVVESTPTIAESATHKRGWGNADALQQIINGDLSIQLEGGRYARSE